MLQALEVSEPTYSRGRNQYGGLTSDKAKQLGQASDKNLNGLILAVTATKAHETAERSAALVMLDAVQASHAVRPTTLGADHRAA